MGVPVNATKGQGCNPISSNCVIWQGPDIPCINLCKGDSISDVTAKLAEQLCCVLDELNISTYDLSCFSPICPTVENFHDLIQFLITKVCELQCIPVPATSSNCPDTCIVPVCKSFYFVNNLGDTVTTMSLTDYVQAIGNFVCKNVVAAVTVADQVNNNSNAIFELQGTVAGQTSAIDNLTILIPSSCLLGTPPPGGWPIQTVVTNLETSFCNLQTATGSPIELLQAIQQECANMDNLKTLTNRSSNYGSIPGWITAVNYNTVADSLNNMWLTICDMRSAVENILKTCCCTDCDDVNISFTATVSGETVTLFFTGSVPTGLTDCFPNGDLVTITDGNGGSFTSYVQVVNNLNGSATINLTSTPINPATDLTITIQGCWNRPAPGSDCGGLKCERLLTYTIVNTAPCPVLTIGLVTTTSIPYSFTNFVSGPVTYVVQLFTAGGTFVSSQTTLNPAVSQLISGTFSGLSPASNYYIVVQVTVNGNTKTCPQAFVSTLVPPCAAPTAVSATNIILD